MSRMSDADKANMDFVTYLPLNSNHPASTNNLAIPAYRSQCIRRIDIPYSEAVDNLTMRCNLDALADTSEVIYGDAVFVQRVSEDNDKERLR